MLRRRCVGLWRRSATAEKSAKSALICGLLAERFHRGDRTTDDPTDYAANGIPAAHPATPIRMSRTGCWDALSKTRPRRPKLEGIA